MKRLIYAAKDWKQEEGIETIEPGVGWSEKTQQYWGWSHRARCGFGIGHEVKEGDAGVGYNGVKVGFKCKTLDDCLKVAQAFAESVS